MARPGNTLLFCPCIHFLSFFATPFAISPLGGLGGRKGDPALTAGHREASRGIIRLGQEPGKSCKAIPLAVQAVAELLPWPFGLHVAVYK